MEFRILELEMQSAPELRDMIDERRDLIYSALREKYHTLVRLCDSKRSYEVPPEYSGLLAVENRMNWSPTDLEVSRVLVGATVRNLQSQVAYSDLVNRLDSIMSVSKPHIYRSLKVILRNPPSGRGETITGICLREK